VESLLQFAEDLERRDAELGGALDAVEQLQREVDGLRTDPSTIERIARDELGMIREDEILFQFPN
jgi:cell division protein FtsB